MSTLYYMTIRIYFVFFVLVYPENSEAQYFADQTGVFEIVQAKDITHGKVMKQV